MLYILFQIIIILYIVLSIYSIIEIQKYNKNGFINDLSNDKKNVKYEISLLNPIIINYNNIIDFDYLMKNHANLLIEDNNTIISLKKIPDLENIHIFKNCCMLKETNLIEIINFDLSIFEIYPIPILLYKQHTLSIFKGYNITPLQSCKHNVNLIYILEGNLTIYLFNPKHKDVILNKDLNSLKKYSHKYILNKGNVLIIPPNWYYIQESHDFVLHYNIDASNIFSIHYNYLR